MSDHHLTQHIRIRSSQRGYREGDVDLVTSYGTNTGTGILLEQKDIDDAEREFKATVSRLRRLKGTYIPTSEGSAKTIFRASLKQQKRLRRRRH
jgi:hypothetical protein